MEFSEIFQRLETNTQCMIDEKSVYKADDGLFHCKKCNGVRQVFVPYVNKLMPCMCKCMVEEKKKQEEEERKRQKNKRLEKLRQLSLIGDKYKNVTFENTETSHSKDFEHIYNRCKKFCEVAQQVLRQGIGIYLFGNKGTGKSRLTACMANALLDKGYSVLYTNFSEISKRIRSTYSTYETELEIIEDLTRFDFLFIDDFGTELVTKNNQDAWLQEKVFEVVNRRYNESKPIIFTSNYSLKELINERGMADKTVDRIAETCEVMKLGGTSYRAKLAKEREKLF